MAAWTLAPVVRTICVRVLRHIKELDDCFGQFLVSVICDCGPCREIEPEVLTNRSATCIRFVMMGSIGVACETQD